MSHPYLLQKKQNKMELKLRRNCFADMLAFMLFHRVADPCRFYVLLDTVVVFLLTMSLCYLFFDL